MYPDQTILLTLHALFNIVDPGQIRSSVYESYDIKIIVTVLIDTPDKNLNLCVDLGQIRLLYL